MQSPIETALVMPPDFGSDIFDTSTRQEIQSANSDAQNNRLAIIRIDRKCKTIIKKVTPLVPPCKNRVKII